MHDDRVSAHTAVRADQDWPQDLRARADDDVILERRVPFDFLKADAAQGDVVVERDVSADLGRFADDRGHAMIDKKARSNLRARMNLDAREPTCDLADRSTWKEEAVAP